MLKGIHYMNYTATGTGDFRVTKRYARYVFILLFLLYAFNCVDRVIVSSLFPFLKTEFLLTDSECGLLASSVTLMMTIFVFPISLLIDRWSRIKTIAIMGLLWGFASLASAFTQNLQQLIALRMIIGIGEAAFTAGGTALISAYFIEEKRATMNGIFSAAVPFGSALGITLGGIIAVHLGWRFSLGILAVPGIIVAAAFFKVQDYKTIAITRRAETGDTFRVGLKFREIVKEFMHTPSVLMAYLGYVGNTFVITGITYWLPTHYNRSENLPMDEAGIKTAVIFLLAIIGAPLGGIITDRIRRKYLNARMTVPAVTSLISALLIFLGFIIEGKSHYIFLLAMGITLPMFVSGAAAVTQDVVHPGLRAVSYSIAQFLMMLLSYTLAPVIVGVISDHYGLMTAFRLFPLFPLFSGIVFFIGSLSYQRDLSKVESVALEKNYGN
jgi:MFS family permease